MEIISRMHFRFCVFLLTLYLGVTYGFFMKQSHHPYHYKWWKGYNLGHSHNRAAPNSLENFYSGIIPYRLFGIPPIQRRPYGNCKPIQLYMVFRHGERNPAVDRNFNEISLDQLMNTINPLIKEKSTGVSPSVDVKFPWKNPYLPKEYGLQVPEGDIQMYSIGQRFAQRFPEILDEFSIADLNFTSSCLSRAQQSATAFGLGYLQGKGHVTKKRLQPIPLTSYPCETDRLHLPQTTCQNWLVTVAANPATRSESIKFLKSNRWEKIVMKVREKLGLQGIKEVNETIVYLMFAACAWGVEKFRYPQDSKWCSLFSKEDQKVYDYYSDLFSYYSFGPGRQINIDIGCPLLQDILNNVLVMAGKTSGSNRRKIIARFGHGTTVIPALHKLGLFLDDALLLANNYEQMRDREFKAGKITPMSGNFAFVLYKCSAYSGHEIYKIQFYHNERLVKVPACHSKVECTLDEFINYYKGILDKCNYDELCSVNNLT